MDTSVWAPFFVFLTICTSRLSVAGLVLPSPENLRVDIWDGEATALWSCPTNAPVDSRYNVEMANYLNEWEKVVSCTGITHTYCDLSGVIHEYNMGYKVKVQLVVGQNASAWTKKKFLPNTSKLRPPSFTLRPTSSSLMVLVHEKPILRKLFPYGIFYSIYLEKRGEDNKNDTAFLKVEDQNPTTFRSLLRGGEYCVSVRVEDKTSKTISAVSPKQCVLLPEQEWYIIAVMSLSGLAVLACTSIVAASLLCYLKRPVKTPAVLKLPVSNWLPLSVGEGTFEAVTDKGWFLSSYTPEGNHVEFPVAGVTRENYKVEERRTSMDSGVSMEANSVEISQGNSPGRHEDSGFGSLSGSESSTSNQIEYSQRARDDKAGTGTDSSVEMACQLRLSSVNLEEQDGPVVVGNYRSQSPSAAPIVARNEAFQPTPCQPVLAEVASGQRSRCHKQGQKGVVGQYRATSTDNGLQRDSGHSSMTFVSYPRETQEAFLAVEDMKSAFVSLEESLPMLTALAPQHVSTNFSLSLFDVLTSAD